MNNFKKALKAMPEPLKSQTLSKGDTDFDDPHFLMYEFWLRFGDGFQKLKVYLDGTLEGFPIGTVIVNNASPFVGRLRAIIRKQTSSTNETLATLQHWDQRREKSSKRGGEQG